jgi:vacuolar-type H+-ATPase subunit D/Vma8
MTIEEMLRRTKIEKKLKSHSSDESYALRKALTNYTVLLDKSLSNEEKAKRLGVAMSTLDRQMNALEKNEISDPEEAKKYAAKL